MKRNLFLLLLIPAFSLTSCSDDDENEPMYTFPEVSDPWKLVNVSGSITGASYDFEPGTITWTFNVDQTVTIVNNNTEENAEDFFDSGTYDFHFEANDATPEMCQQSFFVENLELGCMEATDTQLTLSQVWADGYQLTFIK